MDERFVLRVPAHLDLAGAVPLLCAGITTYSPLRHWNVGKGKKVGIVGLGGLGHRGVTQEMLDFCGQHNITADVEVIPIQKVNEAYERLVKSDVKYRFCIDMSVEGARYSEAAQRMINR